ncbi:MAG: hypothetical protein IJH34_01160 [Romboutsia sp.]|nr:hypothetical protein [Romboutsia sp.]
MVMKEIRGKTVQCRLSDYEFKEVEKKANELGLSVSSYLRMICLKANVNVSFNFENGIKADD